MTDPIDLHAPALALGDVTLSPPIEADREPIRAAAGDPETWAWFGYRADGDHFEAFGPRFLGEHKPPREVRWIVRYRGEVVGATSYLDVEARHQRLEIGGTWYRADLRGTEVNPACKYLLLNRAFAWGARRVAIHTDTRNARSRAAIEKLGATLEGVLHNHMINHDGSQRHTAVYAILPEGWPAVRAKLAVRLGLAV